MTSDFGDVQLLNNLGDRFNIIDGPDAYEGKALRVSYLAGEVGPSNSGGQFFAFLPAEEEYYLEYYIKFDDNFDFQLGGKLPGLSGGESNSGGNKPSGDGWSARLMWRESGKLVVYLYHMDQPTSYGEDFDLNRFAIPGQWHRITQRIKINTGNNNDGILQVWFDGELALLRTDIRYRNNDQAPVDHLFFSTFYGGNTSEWAPDRDGFIYFDDLRIGTNKDDIIPDAAGNLLTHIDKPSLNAVYEAPAAIPIEASASSLDSRITNLAVYANDVLIGNSRTSSASFTWFNVAPGEYTLTAEASDELGNQAISAPIQITVKDIDPEKGPNLALNQQTIVTGEQEGNSGDGAVDGSTDPNDRWSAQGFPQSITVDLGAIKSLNLTEIVPYQDRAYQYTIAVSADNESFQTVVDQLSNTTNSSLLTDSFPETEGRYVRLSVSDAHGYTGEWISIIEFRVFGTSNTAINTLGDVSLDGAVSALDASLILQHSVGLITLSTDASQNAEVSGNGDVSTFDASLILQYVVNLISCFPAEPGCE